MVNIVSITNTKENRKQYVNYCLLQFLTRTPVYELLYLMAKTVIGISISLQ